MMDNFYTALKWSLLPIALVLSLPRQALALQKGSNGSDVERIQRCLQRLGYFNGPVNGNYGSLTQNAVTRFQRANKLPAIGSVGPQTQRLLHSECHSRTTTRRRTSATHRTNSNSNITTTNTITTISDNNSQDLRLGSSGQAVTELQQNLQQLGLFNDAITGYFGSETQQAVMRFQQFYGINPDGVVGSDTQQTIRITLEQNQNQSTNGGGDSLPNALNFGESGDQVRQLQESLRQLRYLNINPSAYFGPSTRDAVARFQQDNGLTPNGIADARTLIAISNALQGQGQTYQSQTYQSQTYQDQTYLCNQANGDICQGERSQRVAAVQQRLQELGFFNGNITGFFGIATQDAVSQFQRYSRINPSGIVNYKTLQALKLGNLGNPIGRNPEHSDRYVVVVPVRNNGTLDKVRQFVPDAFSAESRLGVYVNAGQFRDRLEAERLSGLLRSRGLDARVEYF